MGSEDPGWRALDILEAIYLNRLDLLKDEHRRNFLSQYEREITGQQRQGISPGPTTGRLSTSSASTAMSSSGPCNTKVRRKRSLLQMIDEIIDGADLATQRAEALLKELRKLKEELIARPA